MIGAANAQRVSLSLGDHLFSTESGDVEQWCVNFKKLIE
jgi:hypothetical protein